MMDNGLSLTRLIAIFVDKSSTNLRQLSQECFKSIRSVISQAVHVMFFILQHAKECHYFKRSLVGMIWTSKFVILICYFDNSTKWKCVLSDYFGFFDLEYKKIISRWYSSQQNISQVRRTLTLFVVYFSQKRASLGTY